MLFFKQRHFPLLLVLFLFSCANTEQSTDSAQSAAPKVEKKTTKKAQRKRLTSNNIVTFLTDFGLKNPENIITLSTPKGDIKIKLFDDTPLHRANFIFLSKKGYYDNTVFYRVIPNFMIQGGDTDGYDHRDKKKAIGNYKLPPEILPKYFHERGAVSMARPYDDNPGKKSSAFVFFIVDGETYTDRELDEIEKKYEIKITENQRNVYKTKGGAPHLDGEHTIFGTVLTGMDVVDAISEVKTDEADWPIDDISIKVEVIQ